MTQKVSTRNKVSETKCMALMTKVHESINTSIDVVSHGIGAWKDEKSVGLTITASGVVIPHDCSEIFISTSHIEKIEVEEINGSSYTRILFKK
jgi:hypothetical protein